MHGKIIVNPSGLLLILIMAAVAVIALLVSLYTLRWRSSPGGIYFVLLMVAVAVFAFTNAGEQAVSSLEAKIVWSKLSYLGIVSISPLWFLFAENYNRRWSRLSNASVALFWLLPAITVGLVATNEWHHLIWPAVTVVVTDGISRIIYSHGPAFWIHTFYAYALLLAGSYRFVSGAMHAPQFFRWQVLAIMTAVLIPWVANLAYILELNPWPGIDLTAISFLLSGLILMWALFRFQILDLMPVARDALFESVADGVIVLDRWGRIVDLNPAARDWLAVGDEAIGRYLNKLVQVGKILEEEGGQGETRTRVELGEGEDRSVVDLRSSQLRDTSGRVHGRIVSLHDISREIDLLESERLRVRQLALLNAITQAALSMPDLESMLQELSDRLAEIFSADGAYITLWDDERGCPTPAAAYGSWREKYPSVIIEPGEQTVSEAALRAGHPLAIEDAFNSPYLSPRIAALFPTQSILVLPLIVDDKKLGAVIISFNQTHHFRLEEIELGEQVARQIALAMIKIQLYEAEKKRAAQLAAIQAISHVVLSSLENKQIFETVVKVLHEAFDYEHISIYHLQGETLHMGAQRGYPDETILTEIPVDQGVVGRAVRTRSPQFVPDVNADPDYLPADPEIACEICVPIIQEDTVLGILDIEKTSRHALSATDVNILTTFSNQVAIALENARLFKAEEEQRFLAEALREVGIALSETLDFEVVLERLLAEIQNVIPYDRAMVLLMDVKADRVRIARVRVLEPFQAVTRSQTVTLEYDLTRMTHLQEMAATRGPMAISETHGDLLWPKIPAFSPVRSWAGAPISFQNRVTGFLSLDSLSPGFYHPRHADRLALFARQAAISLENARLFTETQQRAQKERLLFWATRDFNAGLGDETVYQAIAQHMANALDLAGCKISRWDPANDTFVYLLDEGPAGRDPLEGSETQPKSVVYPISRMVIKHQQPISLHIGDPFLDSAGRAYLEHQGIDSTLLLPLVIGQGKQIFGVVELFGKAGAPPFTAEELELAKNLLTQATTAIENARLYAEVQRLAIIDELTGLYNRRGFFEIGRREWQRALRLESPLTALFLDIDHFKQFNDIYSYAVGDQVLQRLAGVLRDNIRKVDVAGRYGGEEFVVLLPETEQQAAREVAERLRVAVLNTRIITDQEEASFTVSIGFCQKTPGVEDLDALVACAGQALHQAKEQGRNRVVSSNPNGLDGSQPPAPG